MSTKLNQIGIVMSELTKTLL
ncbi:MAG: transcriptional regulator, partial [Vibrio sp.]|nr:transcriptional regulator [Vibrio sp.]